MNYDAFLPMTQEDLRRQDCDQLDVIVVTGDAYVDHPAFGAAIIGRYISSLGFTVGIIAMPDVKKQDAFTVLGPPKYFFGVTAGNVDSMLSLFTAQKKIRSDDPYVPGGMASHRPERATIAYCNAIRQQCKGVPIIVGGVEASLRRIAHYDYWSDTVRQSVLLDSKADMLVYGMAEKQLYEIVDRCKNGEEIKDMRGINGTVCSLGKKELDSLALDTNKEIIRLPSFESVKSDKDAFCVMTKTFYEHQHEVLIQESGSRAVLVYPPVKPLTQSEFDKIYELPFAYKPHPSYKLPIPAYEQIKDSITVVRGCVGGCNFCGLGAHQGKTLQSRSKESIHREIKSRAILTEWKGIVSDLGGPTANMYGLSCTRIDHDKPCVRRSCLVPSVCDHFKTDQSQFVNLLNSVSDMTIVKHVAINSGIRMDLALLYPDTISVIAKKATGGLLSVAPEHMSPSVLKVMHKPMESAYESFETIFTRESESVGKKQYLSPYFIAGHPGSTIDDARQLGAYLKKRNIKVRQVQEFIPTPMTVSTTMYYTGKDPFTGTPVQVSYKLSDVRLQKDLIMWWKTKEMGLHHETDRNMKAVSQNKGSGKRRDDRHEQR